MYWWVSAALRSHILEHYEIDPATLDDTIESTVQELTDDTPEPSQKAMALAESLGRAKAITPQLLQKTLREGEVPLFVALFAQFSGIRLALVKRMLYEPGAEGLCIACKGCGIDKSTFASIYLLTRKARGGGAVSDLGDLSTILGLFDRIKPDAADALLKKWQRDPQFLRAIWQVEQPSHR
jgi:uncharacterized protein (DUF2336 family)